MFGSTGAPGYAGSVREVSSQTNGVFCWVSNCAMCNCARCMTTRSKKERKKERKKEIGRHRQKRPEEEGGGVSI